MAEDGEDLKENNILYEVLILSEWAENHDSVISKNALNSSLQGYSSYFNSWNLLRKRSIDTLRFLQKEYPWHLAVSKDGKVLAVLQEVLLEIKAEKDGYTSTVGKACIPKDSCPKLRKLKWSSDNSFLAVARDNGVVYVFNLFGCILATVEVAGNPNGALQPVVGLGFLQPRLKSTKWSNELLIVYQKGDVKSVLLSSLDGQESEENIKFSLNNYYPQGVSSVTFSSNHLLVVAGPPYKNESGITIWRILNDHPFLKCTVDIEKFSAGSRSYFLRFLPLYSNSYNSNTVSQMCVSPSGKMLACLHLSGEISLWRMPAIALYKKWTLQEQPQGCVSDVENDQMKMEDLYCPVEIGWWSENALVIARRNGAISVCSTVNLKNLLGNSPEYLAQCPQISCIEGTRSGIIALECQMSFNYKRGKENISPEVSVDEETSVLQESIQAALYSFTDIERFEPKRKTPKVTQKTYRVIAIKRTTPEELFARKIDNEEYKEALVLAKNYNLDCDLVYQKRWKNDIASKENIHKYLEKINKTQWVVNECLERVPDALEDARELLKFGLEKTDVLAPFENLSADKRQLVIYRIQLLKFLDKLTIYEKIIGSSLKYNSIEYDNFRKQPALVATVNFARKENWQAVAIMFTYMSNEVLPHWLPIISNFPETLKPLNYRSLLPEIISDEVIPWEIKKLRELDWSEKGSYQSLNVVENELENDILYKNYEYLKKFQVNPITVNVVEDWYKSRTYEIEKNAGLVEHALNLVVLARERGVKSMNKLYCDLLTLQSLVYLVGDESTTLKKLETLSHLEQCKLLLSKTDTSTFITDLKNLIVPFSKRYAENNIHLSSSLLRDILLHFSEESLEYPLEILLHLKKGFTNPFDLPLNQTISIVLDCIYSCPKSDQLETLFSILECLPQRSNCCSREDAELHDRIDEVEIYLEICEILEKYEIPKSVKFIRESKNDEETGKQLMNAMADFTRRDTLDFTELLSDFQIIKSKIFPNIPDSFCHELVAFTQMTCECEEIIMSAEDSISCRKNDENKIIPFERSVKLVLEAAQKHIEKAVNFDDHYIELAQTCLKLIEESHFLISEELDLIEAIQLLGDFGVNVLPLQVRKNDNRIQLIDACLKAKPKNYKSYLRLLQLAQALRIYGDDRMRREEEVLIMIAEHALNFSDYEYCSEICYQLINRNFTSAWVIVSLLAQNKEYDNNENKLFFLAFAILHCPIEKAEELIECRVDLQEKHFMTKNHD